AEVSGSTLDTVPRKKSGQNWPEYQTTPSPITMMVAITTYLKFAVRKASFQGFLVICPLAWISRKIGVSCNCNRIQIAIATSRNEIKNGTRHPYTSKSLPK